MSTTNAGKVMTVLGPIEPGALGTTLMHEHVFIDLTHLVVAPTEAWHQSLGDAELTLESRGLLQLDPYISRPNLSLEDEDAAVAELELFRSLGGTSIVELTTMGIKPRTAALAAVSERSGLHIVAGCGYYTGVTHPAEVSERSEPELVEILVDQIANGIGERRIRPGIIGEIGTSGPIEPNEEKVLRVVAAAQRRTGLAVNVHVAIFGRQAWRALDVLDAAGADLSRVVISHLDQLPDLDYHRGVLERGACVEYDCFGSEFYFDHAGTAEPSDRERIDCLITLLEEGWVDQLLISHDVCTKLQLVRYGGVGYGHILRSVLPRLKRRGVDEATFRKLLVENPARLLTIA